MTSNFLIKKELKKCFDFLSPKSCAEKITLVDKLFIEKNIREDNQKIEAADKGICNTVHIVNPVALWPQGYLT